LILYERMFKLDSYPPVPPIRMPTNYAYSRIAGRYTRVREVTMGLNVSRPLSPTQLVVRTTAALPKVRPAVPVHAAPADRKIFAGLLQGVTMEQGNDELGISEYCPMEVTLGGSLNVFFFFGGGVRSDDIHDRRSSLQISMLDLQNRWVSSDNYILHKGISSPNFRHTSRKKDPPHATPV